MIRFPQVLIICWLLAPLSSGAQAPSTEPARPATGEALAQKHVSERERRAASEIVWEYDGYRDRTQVWLAPLKLADEGRDSVYFFASFTFLGQQTTELPPVKLTFTLPDRPVPNLVMVIDGRERLALKLRPGKTEADYYTYASGILSVYPQEATLQKLVGAQQVELLLGDRTVIIPAAPIAALRDLAKRREALPRARR